MRWLPVVALTEIALAAPRYNLRQDVPSTGVFSVDPKPGGTANEDCGDGNRISFTRDEWNNRGMDDKMVKFWNDGISEMVSTGKTWDFHQKWAEKYGSMLYCPSSGRNCDQDSAKLCKDLAGASVEEKQVGLLGLQAIRNAQEIFVRMHEAIGRASDDLLGSLADFSANFLKGAQPDELLQKLFDVAVGIGGTALSFAGPEAEIAAGLLDVSSGVISEFILSPEEDDPFKDFSDAVKIRTTVKKMMEDGLDITHSTIFSNGAYNDKQGVQGPEHMLPNWMHGGAMVDPEAYSELFDIYAPAMTRIMAVRMLEGAFMARGGFVIFIEGHQDECPGWNGCSHSSIDLTCYGEDRFCHPEGIFIPLRVDEEGNVARLDGIDKVGDWDQFGFEKNSLLNSVAWSYLEQGLDSVATASDFTAMIKTFKDTKELENQRGAFTLPVCKISRDHPWQPDLMSETNHPPCDCLGLPDKNGKSFKDYVHPNVRKWLEQSCV